MGLADKIDNSKDDLIGQSGFWICNLELPPINVDCCHLALDREVLVEQAIRLGEQLVPSNIERAAVTFNAPDLARVAFEHCNVRFWNKFTDKIYTRDEFIANLERPENSKCLSLAHQEIAVKIARLIWYEYYPGCDLYPFIDWIKNWIESLILPEIWWVSLSDSGTGIHAQQLAQRLGPIIVEKYRKHKSSGLSRGAKGWI